MLLVYECVSETEGEGEGVINMICTLKTCETLMIKH